MGVNLAVKEVGGYPWDKAPLKLLTFHVL